MFIFVYALVCKCVLVNRSNALIEVLTKPNCKVSWPTNFFENENSYLVLNFINNESLKHYLKFYLNSQQLYRPSVLKVKRKLREKQLVKLFDPSEKSKEIPTIGGFQSQQIKALAQCDEKHMDPIFTLYYHQLLNHSKLIFLSLSLNFSPFFIPLS